MIQLTRRHSVDGAEYLREIRDEENEFLPQTPRPAEFQRLVEVAAIL